MSRYLWISEWVSEWELLNIVQQPGWQMRVFYTSFVSILQSWADLGGAMSYYTGICFSLYLFHHAYIILSLYITMLCILYECYDGNRYWIELNLFCKVLHLLHCDAWISGYSKSTLIGKMCTFSVLPRNAGRDHFNTDVVMLALRKWQVSPTKPATGPWRGSRGRAPLLSVFWDLGCGKPT